MQTRGFDTCVLPVLILIYCAISSLECAGTIGDEMKPNRGPILQNVESEPFVPVKNVLIPSEVLSPDDILKGSEILSPLEIREDQFLPYAFDLDHFVDVSSDPKIKHELESSIMRLFLNASQTGLDNGFGERVSF